MKYLRTLNNRPQKVIAIHIPKTAGTTVSRLFKANGFIALPFIEKYSLSNLKCKLKSGQQRPGKHAKARDIKMAMGDRTWEEYFSFAIVRNPWDLMVSSYHWWLQKAYHWEKFKKSLEEIEKMNDFNEFISSKYGRIMLNEHYGSFKDWICDEEGKIIVDFVGKLETFSEDWNYICKQLNIDNNFVKIPQKNKTVRSNYQNYYNSQSQKIIEDRFEWSIQKFGYTFL